MLPDCKSKFNDDEGRSSSLNMCSVVAPMILTTRAPGWLSSPSSELSARTQRCASPAESAHTIVCSLRPCLEPMPKQLNRFFGDIALHTASGMKGLAFACKPEIPLLHCGDPPSTCESTLYGHASNDSVMTSVPTPNEVPLTRIAYTCFQRLAGSCLAPNWRLLS